MNSKTKTIIFALALAVFIGIAYVAYNTLSKSTSQKENITQQDSEQKEKTKAPDFTVTDADGNEVKLSEMIGKPMIINFWASWCPPCKSEMPEFNKVYEEMGDEITFMMIDSVDGQRETKEVGEQYIADQGFTFPVYYDTTGEASYTYGIRSIPTTYFIDAEGYIVARAVGAIDEDTLLRGIEMAR